MLPTSAISPASSWPSGSSISQRENTVVEKIKRAASFIFNKLADLWLAIVNLWPLSLLFGETVKSSTEDTLTDTQEKTSEQMHRIASLKADADAYVKSGGIQTTATELEKLGIAILDQLDHKEFDQLIDKGCNIINRNQAIQEEARRSLVKEIAQLKTYENKVALVKNLCQLLTKHGDKFEYKACFDAVLEKVCDELPKMPYSKETKSVAPYANYPQMLNDSFPKRIQALIFPNGSISETALALLPKEKYKELHKLLPELLSNPMLNGLVLGAIIEPIEKGVQTVFEKELSIDRITYYLGAYILPLVTDQIKFITNDIIKNGIPKYTPATSDTLTHSHRLKVLFNYLIHDVGQWKAFTSGIISFGIHSYEGLFSDLICDSIHDYRKDHKKILQICEEQALLELDRRSKLAKENKSVTVQRQTLEQSKKLLQKSKEELLTAIEKLLEVTAESFLGKGRVMKAAKWACKSYIERAEMDQVITNILNLLRDEEADRMFIALIIDGLLTEFERQMKDIYSSGPKSPLSPKLVQKPIQPSSETVEKTQQQGASKAPQIVTQQKDQTQIPSTPLPAPTLSTGAKKPPLPEKPNSMKAKAASGSIAP